MAARATQALLCSRRLLDPAALAAIATVGIFALSRPYAGIVGDARLYVGRGVADLDPGGVGQDATFVNDGQSNFTIFRALTDGLVALIGPSTASMTLAALALCAWFVALVVFARAIDKRATWTIAICVAILPFFYGAFDVLRLAEPLAVPRPYAEALVVAAIAALGSGRVARALALLATALLFHPIMALAGFAVFLLVAIYHDRRWLMVLVVALGETVAAAAAGVPLATRLFTSIDADWLSILEARNTYLFPHLWGLRAFGLIVVQSATLIIATRYLDRRWRVIFSAALAAGLAGLTLAFIAGKPLTLLLLVQLQFWRLWWLTAVLAVVSFAVVLPHLWNGGTTRRLILALLTVAWALHEQTPLAVASSMVALYLHVRSDDQANEYASAILKGVLVIVLIPIAVCWLAGLKSLGEILSVMPADHNPGYARAFAIYMQPFLIVTIAFGWKLLEWLQSHRVWRAGACLALGLAGLAFWDDRGPYERVLDRAEPQTTLIKLLPARQGEVLWLTANMESWLWLGRANWLSGAQGAGILFSRPLAMLFAERAKFLIDLDLVGAEVLEPWLRATASSYPILTADRLARVCQRFDAPVAIIAPMANESSLPQGMPATLWRAPVARFKDILQGDKVSFQRLETFAVFDCASFAVPTPS
jgi:hypothetical protein